jgi:ribosomal-protein-alanine N-acetyltransferase
MTWDATIQKMTFDDLDVVVGMESDCSLVPWSREMFVHEMSSPLTHCFTLRTKEPSRAELTGFICFRTVEDESELLNLCVHPAYRRLGFALEMMTFYIHFCRTTNIRQLFLEVGCTNEAAVRLYESLSYKPVGKRSKFYQGRFDAWIMRRDVEA